MTPIRLMSGFLTVGGWTLLSRVLGFVRDALILALIGTGPLYQAFVVAFRLPNMFRRFFAEGAFNMAFVPIYSKKLEAGENPDAFASEAFSGLASVLILLTLVLQLAMPWAIIALASGFKGQDEFAFAVEFGRIAFPYIVLISLAALISGVLNAAGRFAAAAAAPVALNVLLIAGVSGAHLAGLSAAGITRVLVWTIPLAGCAQLAIVWWSARRARLSVRFVRPRYSPAMRRLVAVAFPAALAAGVVQINLVVGQQVASYFDNAVGWLFAADRLYQLPLGVVGIAIGIVLLPDLSRRLSAGDDQGGRDALSRAAEAALALTIPAAVALVIVPLPIVSVLFERGAVTSDDSAAIALAVAVYGLGLPAFVLQKILQPLYFAREDTRSPFRYALVAMVVNAAVAVGLAFAIGWIAPAVATSFAAWVMVALLFRGTRPMGEIARFDDRFHRRIWRIVAAALAMGVLWVASLLLGPALGAPGWRYLALLALVAAGFVSYFSFASLFGGFHLSELRSSLRRRKA